MATANALEQIHQRRKAFWLWFPIALLIDALIIGLFQFTVGEPPKWIFTVLNVLMNSIGLVLLMRIGAVRCPKCKKPALRASLVFTSINNLRCYHCDYLLNKQLKGKKRSLIIGKDTINTNFTKVVRMPDTDPWTGKRISKDSEQDEDKASPN
ncbi:hypothetical protein [Methylomonas sp. AM2-LC]|uniref:hypothetical protein n=1 Tax=Methylomonas sp. AM2-LC TaxID=3153301 RepID=UPI0032637A75